MDKTQKERLAKLIVGLDDAIASSNGIAALLGHIIALGVSSLVGADIAPTSTQSKTDALTEGDK